MLVVVGGLFYARDRSAPPIEYRAERGPFERTVSVSGAVIAQSEVELGFAQGGRVERVRAVVGELVREGALIAELENDDIHALIAQRNAALLVEEAVLRSLEDGARPEAVAVSESAVRTAEIARDQAVQSIIEKIQDAFRVADDAVRVKADTFILNPRTQPQLEFITTDAVTKVRLENTRAALEETLPMWERAVFALTPKSDVRAAFTEAQAQLIEVSTFLVDARTVISKGLPTGTVSSDDLAAYAADTASARSSINTAIASLTASDTALKSSEAALETARRNLELTMAGATRSALEEQRARIESARAALRDAQAQLKRTQVVAPFSGVVTRVDIEAGEIAGQGPVFSLISEGELEIESYIPEIYIADIMIGDTASVSLDAYGDTLPLTATIVAIDPAETIRDGVATYRTMFHLTESHDGIKPGMTAGVTITTDERQDILAIPHGFVRREEGRTFVYVKSERGSLEREVQLGESASSGLVEILNGLTEGEIVLDPQ
jgi:HlyD family secretion protein